MRNKQSENPIDCELERYHIELIESGIQEADRGELVPHAEVVKMIAELGQKTSST